jgi:molecular chaperone IbpA
MTTIDFSPLFRSVIGFDRMARLASSVQAAEASYPPYNIEKTGDDSYRLTLAVAGFRLDEIEITVKENALILTGKVANRPRNGEVLYRGIAGRSFERRFVLADHIVVEGAEMANGLLHVGLKRVVPEALKPRRVEITTPSQVSTQQTIANDSGATAKAA